MPTGRGRRLKRSSSPNTSIPHIASALRFLRNPAKRGRTRGPLAARRGSPEVGPVGILEPPVGTLEPPEVGPVGTLEPPLGTLELDK